MHAITSMPNKGITKVVYTEFNSAWVLTQTICCYLLTAVTLEFVTVSTFVNNTSVLYTNCVNVDACFVHRGPLDNVQACVPCCLKSGIYILLELLQTMDIKSERCTTATFLPHQPSITH